MYFARPSHFGAGCVVVGWDTSGSTHALVDAFFAEMAGIVKDLNPAQLVVIRCDAAVHGVDDMEDPDDLNGYREQINQEGIGGGGGTSFVPVFDKIAELELQPDVVVYLTDLLGTFPPMQPDYPVVWANVAKGQKAPWGDQVDIEL
jgi:predicted metal-dependent peptidase